MYPLVRRNTSPSLSTTCPPSLSSSGWTPSRPTISPPSATYIPATPSSDTSSLSSSPDHEPLLSQLPARPAAPPLTRRHSDPAGMAAPPSSALALLTTPATPHHHCAYPSWPARQSLSVSIAPLPGTAAASASPEVPVLIMPVDDDAAAYMLPTSHISDEDLEQLDFALAGLNLPDRGCAGAGDVPFACGLIPSSTKGGDDDTDGLGISWSAVGGVHAEVVRAPERRRRLPPPPPAMAPVRRRSSSRGVRRRSRASTLTAIAE